MAGFMDNLGDALSNPLFLLGTGILASNRPGASFGQALGRGGMLASQGYQQSQLNAARLAKAEEEKKARQAAIQRGQNIAALVSSPQYQAADVPTRQTMMAQYAPDLAAKQAYAQPAPQGKPVQVMGPDGVARWAYPSEAVGMEVPPKKPLVEQQINLPSNKQLSKESEKVGGYYGEVFINTQKAETSARMQNAKLRRIDRLFEDTYTGLGGKALLSAKQLAQVLGIDVSGVGEAEAAQAIANEMALELRNPSGGAGMPGAMSDSDRAFLQNMTPGLTTSKEGRKLMIETRRKINQRSIEVGKMAREYRKKNGALDEGFHDILAAYSEENPLFDEESKAGVNFVQDAPKQLGGWSIKRLD